MLLVVAYALSIKENENVCSKEDIKKCVFLTLAFVRLKPWMEIYTQVNVTTEHC